MRSFLLLTALSLGVAAQAGAGALDGRWKADGKATEVEYGPEVVQSPIGLPAGQQIGVIGKGPGSYAWGVRNSYKTYEVQRSGELRLQPDGSFRWEQATESKRSSNCWRTTEWRMAGTAVPQGERLVLRIAQGEQKVSWRGCPGTQTTPKTESLAGQQRTYEAKVEGGVLKIRQVEPVSAISSSAVYQRG